MHSASRQQNAGGATDAQAPTPPAACDRNALSALLNLGSSNLAWVDTEAAGHGRRGQGRVRFSTFFVIPQAHAHARGRCPYYPPARERARREMSHLWLVCCADKAFFLLCFLFGVRLLSFFSPVVPRFKGSWWGERGASVPGEFKPPPWR